MEVERWPTYALNKNFKTILKKNLLHLLHIFLHTENVSIVLVHNVIISTAASCVFSASCSNYLFHANIFSTQEPNTTIYFRQTVQGLAGENVLLAQINKREGCNKNVLVCMF